MYISPGNESGKLNIEASDMNIKIARAGYIPTLSLSAGIGTTNANGNDFSFSEQVKQNWNNSIGLTLSIPIFDKRQTKSTINKAKLQMQTSQLDLMDEQKTLYKTIESLWLSAQQRPTAIRSRHPKAEKYTGQLRPRQRTVQPGYEEYRRTAHRKEQPAERTAGNASGQIHSHTQCRPAALLSGRRNQSALSHQ